MTPPGRSNETISSTTCSGSGMLTSTNRENTTSNDSLGRLGAFASPCTTSTLASCRPATNSRVDATNSLLLSSPTPGPRCPPPSVGGLPPRHELAGRRDEFLALIQPDHGPARPHTLGKQIEHPTLRPAADIERPRARANLELIKQPPGLTREFLDLLAERLFLRLAAPQKIDVGFCHSAKSNRHRAAMIEEITVAARR